MSDWTMVDEGWGRRAIEFATLSEPANCREYVALHELLGVTKGERLLDIACGAGLAVELAALRGAECAGVDASERLIKVARDRSPSADLRVGDMHALPWDDSTFDVVTSFRGIWGTTPEALDEARRVLKPGGRLGITVWGHIKASPGAWALTPFLLASQPKVVNQAAMVSLGRPGVGEALLIDKGFLEIARNDITSVWEFPDPATYARALASTGPAYEAIQSVGEEEFLRVAEDGARQQFREGLPLRASIAIVAYTARKPSSTPEQPILNGDARQRVGFLQMPKVSEAAQRMFDEDVDDYGFVMNASRLWAYAPEVCERLFELLGSVTKLGSLNLRQRGILVAATASTLGDAYCSLAWGSKLAHETSATIAGNVLRGVDEGLDDSEKALATWARRVVSDPNRVTEMNVDELRNVGFTDTQIFAITVFVAGRLAFSTINDALGAQPDYELLEGVAREVRDAVTFGRPAEGSMEFGVNST
ncbi:MAG: methyltransferase domain-containing protein [Acidimicrobiales bacterium]|jgi:SAM-dependent methyltransferase/alkylhydroperoxidase family enzyme